MITNSLKSMVSKLVFIVCLSLIFIPQTNAANICGSKEFYGIPGIGGTGKISAPGTGGTGKTLEHISNNTGIDRSGKDQPGIGGTGKTKPGIGGTGIASDRGIGGTGIIGVITGFGSICVNGIEIDYNTSTPVSNDGITASVHQLKLGQVVEVMASGSGEHQNAHQINILHLVNGPVSPVHNATHHLEILGQPIEIIRDTIIDTAIKKAGSNRLSLQPDQTLQVSGFRRRDGTIIATRIDSGKPQQISLLGRVENIKRQQLRVNGVTVKFSNARVDNKIKVGSEIFVTGNYANSAIHAKQVTLKPSLPFSGKARHVVIQGFLRQKVLGTLNGSNISIELSDNTRVDGGDRANLGTSQLAIVSGAIMPSGQVKADYILLDNAIPRVQTPRHSEVSDHEKNENQHHENGTELDESSEIEHDNNQEDNHDGQIRTELPERKDSNNEHPEVERPEVERPEVERPEIQRPEVQRPEVQRPEVQRPEIQRPEIQRPEIQRPEIQRPELPEIEKPD